MVHCGAPSGVVVTEYLHHGAGVDAVNNAKQTSLHKACVNGHEAVAQLLLQRGADVDAAD